jgi:segregation and condensation protein A
VRIWFDRVASARLPDVASEDLRTAWAGLIARARINRHHLVTREQLSVRAEMSRMLRMLALARYIGFTSLFAAHADVPHLVVTFLALLELARERLVRIAQAEAYAPIYVQLTACPAFALESETGPD